MSTIRLLGVGLGPEWLFEDGLKNGNLQSLLTGYDAPPVLIKIIYVANRLLLKRAIVFMHFIAEAFSKIPALNVPHDYPKSDKGACLNARNGSNLSCTKFTTEVRNQREATVDRDGFAAIADIRRTGVDGQSGRIAAGHECQKAVIQFGNLNDRNRLRPEYGCATEADAQERMAVLQRLLSHLDSLAPPPA